MGGLDPALLHDEGEARPGTGAGRVLMGLYFFPRGGSAHVARNLARALPGWGWEVTVASGSLPGRPGDARDFYAGCELAALDMSGALAAPDPMLADPPLHASYEDRPGAPDRWLASLGPAELERQVRAWSSLLERAGAADAEILHLHHLTPLNEAARRVAPDVPVVGHLHGTELLMLERLQGGARAWPHGLAWLERMRDWAAGCARVVVLSDSQVARVGELLDVPAEACLRVPNGYDPDLFHPRDVDRRAFWRRHLVEAPRGWEPGRPAGSVAYAEEDLDALGDGRAVLLYVGRFTAVKRIGVLLEAFARVQRDGAAGKAALVLCGGFPGEWEGEHPADAIRRLGLEDVFLAGWHEHDELPGFLAGCDAVVLPSVREQFGQVLVEGMACARPVVAVDAFGPAEIVEDGHTGRLVGPDDPQALADVLSDAVARPDAWRAMGRAAQARARELYAWPALAGRVAGLYAGVAREARA